MAGVSFRGFRLNACTCARTMEEKMDREPWVPASGVSGNLLENILAESITKARMVS